MGTRRGNVRRRYNFRRLDFLWYGYKTFKTLGESLAQLGFVQRHRDGTLPAFSHTAIKRQRRKRRAQSRRNEARRASYIRFLSIDRIGWLHAA